MSRKSGPPILSVVVPVYGQFGSLENLLASLEDSLLPNFQVIIIDDSSPYPVQEWLRGKAFSFDFSVIRRDCRGGFFRAILDGLNIADCEIVAVVNSDTYLPKNGLANLLGGLVENERFLLIGPSSNAAGSQSFPRFETNMWEQVLRQTPVNRFPGRESAMAFGANLCRVFGQEVVPWPLLHGFFVIGYRSFFGELETFNDEDFPGGMGFELGLVALVKENGGEMGFQPGTFIHHDKSVSFKGFERWANLVQSTSRIKKTPRLSAVSNSFDEAKLARKSLQRCFMEAPPAPHRSRQ